MTKGLSFLNRHGGILKISERALVKMRNYVQNKPHKKEAGGVLLGRFIINSFDVIVDDVSIPMSGDKRTRYSFFRKAKPHQKIIDFAWGKSRHRCNYLGGWHTHAEAIPSYSDTDICDWRKALVREQFDNNVLYFVIVGTSMVCVWEGNKVSRHILQLEPNY